MNVIAVIPARGGSKGIPFKNIRLFNGKPLIATSIDAALASKYVNQVYVSTDSELIAQKTIECGAYVIERPKELGCDTASSESALLDALEQLSKQGSNPDLLVFLQCTAPFLTAKDIDGTIEKLINENADSALAVVPFNHFLWSDEKDGAKGINHDGLYRKRRQDLKPQYLEAGSVYVMRVDKFKEQKTRFCGKTALYEIDDPAREHEIDDASEFYVAEAKLEWFKKTKFEQESYRTRAKDFENKISNIRALVLDFDGIFTDDSVYVDEFGKESIKCSRSDGMGIELLKKNTSLEILVLSTEQNKCVLQRCNKLNLNVINSCKNKIDALSKWASLNKISLEHILYCGNDLNDLPMIDKVGLFVCPQNAQLNIKNKADLILNSTGSTCFVREMCELLLNYKSFFPKECFYKLDDSDLRPWGSWKILSCKNNECIKEIVVNPNCRLSYQSHNYRQELWLIKSGEGTVTLDGIEHKVKAGDKVLIKQNVRHRIKNISNVDYLEFIEIQTGNLLNESDITRFEDDYNRS